MKFKKTSATDTYLNAIKKDLTCSRTTRKKLLSGLRQEIFERNAENDPSSILGSPESVAAELQKSVADSEVRYIKNRNKALLIVGVVVALAALAVLAIYLIIVIRAQPVRVVEYIHDVKDYSID